MGFRARKAEGRFAITASSPPLLHHPVIAISLILIAASLAQMAVWLVETRLPTPAARPVSSIMVHGMLFDGHAGDGVLAYPVALVGCLLIALLSGVAWYATARVALGPSWALWAGLCWVSHPSFAFLAQRPTAATLLFVLIPTVWCLLLWWKRSRRWLVASLIGLGLGLISLVSVLGVLLLPLVILAMLLAAGRGARSWLGSLFVLAACIVPVAAWFARYTDAPARSEMRQRAQSDLWHALDNADGSVLAEAARTVLAAHSHDDQPSPVRFLGAQLAESCGSTVTWFVGRCWRTLYATSNGQLQRPLFVLHLLWLVPAAWGWVVALRHPPWRWMAASVGMFVAIPWSLAALAEPLARNLTPVGGMGIILALIGVADLHERIFGRRLTERAVSARPGGASGEPLPDRRLHRP